MDMHRQGWPPRLRERPPSWPRRNDGGDPGGERRRWLREREPFEDDALPELYPGALAMEDLSVTNDDTATLRVLARYTVLRVLVLTMSGALSGKRLRVERRVALEHLALLPVHDWERRALERVAMLCRDGPAPEIVDAIVVGAEAAAKRSQTMGAFGLYRAAYELACSEGWWEEASQAARGISQLARLEEARYSIRLWRRRAIVMDRRAAAAADTAAGAAAAEADAGADTAEAGPGADGES